MAATSATSSGSNLALSGIASGMDWTTIVSEMLTIESAPETQMSTNLANVQSKDNAFTAIGTKLTALQTDLNKLSLPSFYDARTTSQSNSSVATAKVASAAPLGTYSFNVVHLATDASISGAPSAKKISSSNDVSGVTLSSMGLATPITAGTFTINGQSITVATSDTLKSVFDKINTATGGAVTASYSASADEISLNSSSEIVLGSANDTSNFLGAAELYPNGMGTITSTAGLGAINLTSTLASANTQTAITDGGSGAGKFTINGVEIDYNSTTDTVSSVLNKINNSTAGVTATYNSQDDQFTLTNKTTGDVGISMQDETGNFLAATGLSSGALNHGLNLQYQINGGSTLTSQSNTIDASTSGVTGLSLTATGTGLTNVTIGSDTSSISSAISQLVTDYNSVQTYISSQTATTTNADGSTTAGLLTGNMDVENIMTKLRSIVGQIPNGGVAGVESLTDIGVTSNGTDNTLSFSATSSLTTALTNNLAAVKNLFTNSTNGIATSLQSYLNSTLSPSGVLTTNETSFTSQENSLNSSITTLKQKVSADQTRLTNEFTAMETAISSINTEKAYLNSYFSGSSTTTNAAPGGFSSSSSSSS